MNPEYTLLWCTSPHWKAAVKPDVMCASLRAWTLARNNRSLLSPQAVPKQVCCCKRVRSFNNGKNQGVLLLCRQYSKEYIPLEESAHAAHRGIWAGSFQEPAQWRREQKHGNSTGPNLSGPSSFSAGTAVSSFLGQVSVLRSGLFDLTPICICALIPEA